MSSEITLYSVENSYISLLLPTINFFILLAVRCRVKEHAGSFEITKQAYELVEAIAESKNSRFLSALQTSQVMLYKMSIISDFSVTAELAQVECCVN